MSEENETLSSHAEEPFRNPLEGPIMMSMGVIGVLSNLLCLMVLRKRRELKLSADYLNLLCAQSTFDLLYLVISTPLTALPFLVPDLNHSYYSLAFLLWTFPFVQMTMTASVYSTIVLSVERYLSIREPNTHRAFPVRPALIAITIFSFVVNIPRFMEFRITTAEGDDYSDLDANVNKSSAGDIHVEEAATAWAIEPIPEFYTLKYFLGYNMICSFTVTMLIPMGTLGTFNLLIWRRLQGIWHNRTRLGLKEKRNTKACVSLLMVVVIFFICHSMKFVVSGYQLVTCLLDPQLRFVWPHWVEVCTFVSHFLLATGASVNILLFCSCDKRFFVVVQKTLKSWFVWPLTVKGESVGYGSRDEDDLRGLSLRASCTDERQDSFRTQTAITGLSYEMDVLQPLRPLQPRRSFDNWV